METQKEYVFTIQAYGVNVKELEEVFPKGGRRYRNNNVFPMAYRYVFVCEPTKFHKARFEEYRGKLKNIKIFSLEERVVRTFPRRNESSSQSYAKK